MGKKKREKAPKKRGKKKSVKKAKEVDPDAVRAYYKKTNDWRATLSKFGLSTTVASDILNGGDGSGAKKKKKKAKKKTKKGKKAAAAPKKKRGKKKGKKKGKKAKSVDAPYGYKKDGVTPKKAPGRKSGKKTAAKKAPKKRRKKKAGKRSSGKTAEFNWSKDGGDFRIPPRKEAVILEWLLGYRKKHQKAGHMTTLDAVIIDLTATLMQVG